MANAVYCRPSEIVTSAATIVGTTADSAYPATFLHDGNPAKPAKLTGTTGNFVFDFGSARSIDMAAIIHHNLDAGLDVKIQGNASDSWGSPTLSQSITIPAIREDNFRWNVYKDLTALTRSFRYWRLLINSANSSTVKIGEFLLISTKRTIPENLQVNFTRELNHPIIDHRTDTNVATIQDLGTTWETIRGIVRDTEAGATLQESLFRDAGGRSEAFFFIQDPGTSEPLYVRRVESKINFQFPWPNRARQVYTFELEEVGRGLYL